MPDKKHSFFYFSNQWLEFLIQLLQKVQVRLILMDLRMPQIDGYEAAQMIRSGKGGPLHIEVPIIALSVYNSKEEKEKCLAAGMNDFIPKPFEPQQLLSKIQKWLHRPPSN